MVCNQTEMLLSEIYWFNKNDRTFLLLGPKHRNMNCITTVTTTSTSRTPLLKDQQQTKTTEKTIWSIKVKVARLFLQKKGQEKAWHYMCATKWKGKELKQMTEARSKKEQEGMRGMNSKKVSRVDRTKGDRRNGKRKEKEKWEWKKEWKRMRWHVQEWWMEEKFHIFLPPLPHMVLGCLEYCLRIMCYIFVL